ncbi:hypothetical protein KUTeg_017751 [Tegillarca granosa]|uniref:Reverse transcriptase RNase H-like domain-containing protein n=1 Tax=Tegillarca granosa TaxID=220873 RepID=A0ABQ9ELN7_TEGGR|nr:hypothetical protein KUTeg_017751 [Tegillarca granosa]
MTVMIPSDKLCRLKDMLSELIMKNKTTLKDLQSLVGLLNFCTRAIPPARAFNRRFYDAMSGQSKPFHRIRINKEMKEDINVWLMFLDLYNGISCYDVSQWLSDYDLHLFTDSAGNAQLGCAAVLETHWCFMQWPISWHNKPILKDISFLELVPISLAFNIWSSNLQNKKIILHTDNLALVSILNKKSSKSKRVMQLIRPLVLQSMIYNIQFKSVHIDGKYNVVADALSRQQWNRFHQEFKEKDPCSTQVPQSFHSLLLKVEKDRL